MARQLNQGRRSKGPVPNYPSVKLPHLRRQNRKSYVSPSFRFLTIWSAVAPGVYGDLAVALSLEEGS